MPRRGSSSRSTGKGRWTSPYIASLYGVDEARVIEELGELIYQDPETKGWQTADEYLSGNVREKLPIAERAGDEWARNAEALRAVQPEDVLPGEIDANLGAPWVPEGDIRAFAAELFGVPPSSIAIGHLKKDALWSVEAGYDATSGVPATSDYGTARANGIGLLEQALNLKTPVIYDTVNHGGREERVVNQEETLAAREKQKRIKDAFRSWVFSDPERCERLVRVYNDTYNNFRLRVFDGSHLAFPGMNRTITLHPHQKDAIWRGMSDGNTLLAHVVGAGKTFTMACIGMKRKAAGLSRKPLYVVPNHMLEQFAREAQQLYPNAKLLVATKEDLVRSRRKALTAKMAGSEWDGIIITHSSFERIGMSREYQARFLREQIAEYDALLVESGKNSNRAHRNIIKTIEKQKARREERLKDLLAEEKKDDGLVFDELGVDYLFIDEAHYFKNLETPTKMDRVAGIQTGGSERAFDLYMKVRYLGELHEGHGVTFATGTPDLEHDGRDVHDAAVPRPEGPQGPGHRALRRVGRDLRRGRRHDGDCPGRVVFKAEEPVCEVRESARVAADVPLVRRRADGRDARPSDAPSPRREADRRAVPDVRGAARHPGAARGPLRANPLREGGPAGGQRPGDHDRRQEARPRRPARLGRGARVARVEGERPGRAGRRHLAARPRR